MSLMVQCKLLLPGLEGYFDFWAFDTLLSCGIVRAPVALFQRVHFFSTKEIGLGVLGDHLHGLGYWMGLL